MLTVPIITDNILFAEAVKAAIEAASQQSISFTSVVIDNAEDALDFFNMEMPDLACVDFSSKAVRPFELLDTIISDPWLLHAGIIAFCDSLQEERSLGDLKKVNIIDVVRSQQVNVILPKIMNIIANNRQILFQRVIGTDIPRNLTASIELENDLHVASCYANLLANYLYTTNKIDREGKAGLAMVMHELLINAIEHGNCEISYDEKTALLDSGADMDAIIGKRCENPAIASRRVNFDYTITAESSTFKISDQGRGFDWRALPDPTNDLNCLLSHGRGILMARSFTKNLMFNEKGNAVEFDVEHALPEECVMPGIFKDIGPTSVLPGEIILNEGDRSDFLYYIVNGEFDVLVNGNSISRLSEEDLFLGEMAFLLDHRRTATVKAVSSGRLIKVSKREFVEAIKKKPHYALLLARLLAKRIERINTVHAEVYNANCKSQISPPNPPKGDL